MDWLYKVLGYTLLIILALGILGFIFYFIYLAIEPFLHDKHNDRKSSYSSSFDVYLFDDNLNNHNDTSSGTD